MFKINEVFYHLKGRDNFVQKSHSHNEIEFIHVIRGNGIVVKNDKTYPLKSQNIYVIDARNTHIVYPDEKECDDYIRNKIVADADSFERFCEKIGIYEAVKEMFCMAPISTLNADVDGFYKKIDEAVNSNDFNEYGFAYGYIIELIHWIYSQKDSGKQNVMNTTVQKVIDYVSLKSGITTLNEISRELYMNKFYICHIFKEKTGYNLSDYIADKKYVYAIKLLKENTCTIEEIAVKCGYSAPSSFSRFFISKAGISPARFRKTQ